MIKPLTIPEIRRFLSNGKKNGEFSSYQEAYLAVSRLYEMNGESKRKFNLIYIDDDDIPELVADDHGYGVSLYTYSDGKVYTLMDFWAYGIKGNSGYEYAPGMNNLRKYNTEYAGEIFYTTYMTITQQKVLDEFLQVKTYLFDDANGNGVLDEEEMDPLTDYVISFVDGEQISETERFSYDKGEYEYIYGNMSLEELRAKLNE